MAQTLPEIVSTCEFEPEEYGSRICKWCGERKGMRIHTITQAITQAVNEAVGEDEVYTELEYKHVDDEGEPLWSKNAIRESRKQRMARVVNRNELRAEIRANLMKFIEGTQDGN